MNQPRKKTRRDERSSSGRNRRLRIVAAATLFVALVAMLILWLRREPAWSVKLTPDSTTTTTFAPVTLHAEVLPAGVLAKSGWHFQWSTESGRVTGDGKSATFSADHEGEFPVRLTVKSPWGTEKRAETAIVVQAAPLLSAFGHSRAAQSDPTPDVNRGDLPFRIVDVTVDKPEVCRGEQTVIRVRAEDDRGRADWLLPTIGGKVGWAVTLAPPGNDVGQYKIPVSITDPEGAKPDDREPPFQRASAYVTLKDCDPPSVLHVSLSRGGEAEEDVRLSAAYYGAGEIPASYRWDFGDASAQVTTKERQTQHLFPSEEERGPGKRIFTYLVQVDALDASGKVLASAVKDVWLTNHIEEFKYTMHLLQLVVLFPPVPRTEESGDKVTEVTLKNLDVAETANLTSLEYRLGPCDGKATAAIEQHSPSDVFSGTSVPPRGTLQGTLRWPSGSSDAVCFLDVTIHGSSSPSNLSVGGVFSMRTQINKASGAISIKDPEQAKAIAKMMEQEGKTYLTPANVGRAGLGRVPNQPDPPPVSPRHAPKPGQ